MTLFEYFAARSGNQAALVRALGLPQTTVAHWASRSRSVPAEYVLSIESATKNAVSRKDLLPNSWASIWPEQAATSTTTIDAALAEARQVFAGSQPALDALAYVDGVLAASPAPATTLTSTAICDLKLKVDTGELDAALALAEKLKEVMAVCAPSFAAANAHIATTISTAGEKAAAAMRAESAQLVADAERTTGQAGSTHIDPLGDLSREVRLLSDWLHLRHELAAQLLILAELRHTHVDYSVNS